MTWLENVMLHISRSGWSSWAHLWFFFFFSSWSLSKVIAEKLLVTFHDLKWPCRHGEGSLVAIFRHRVSSLPVNRCLRVFRMVFFQEAPFIFFHWLIMERSQNLPGLGSPISQFRDIHFIDTCTDINRWTCQGERAFGVAMTSIQTFFLGEVTWRDLMTWPWVTWVWNFQNMCGKDVWTSIRKTAKNLRGRKNVPPSTARVKSILNLTTMQKDRIAFHSKATTYLSITFLCETA